jgi:hypothetical protein
MLAQGGRAGGVCITGLSMLLVIVGLLAAAPFLVYVRFLMTLPSHCFVTDKSPFAVAPKLHQRVLFQDFLELEVLSLGPESFSWGFPKCL